MAYNIELAAGKYRARALSAGAYESTGGALMVGVQWELDNPERNTITSRTCLISKAGVVQEKRIAEIREWAPGWDGVSMEWFGQHFTEFDVEVVIERRVDSYDNKEKPEVAFINPVGGGSGHNAIPAADQKALGAKYGARLRAIAGAAPKPMNTATPATPKPAAHDPVAEKKTAAWNAFKETYTGADGERNTAWFALVARAVPGKTDYNTFTADDWDAVINAAKSAAPAVDDMPF